MIHAARIVCGSLIMWLTFQNVNAQETKEFLSMPAGLVPFNSDMGKRLFRESSANESFWRLSQFYLTQPDSGSCGVASSIITLNALAIERPLSTPHGQFRLFTPANFFTPAVEAIRPREKVSAAGMTLDQLGQILATYPVDVGVHHATADGLAEFRATLKVVLSQPDKFVLINYLRKVIGQQIGGHISPLAAYNEEHDMVLVLDVTNYKYPWIWVHVDEIWQAMLEVDEDSKQSRGYVLISAKPKSR